MIFSICNKTVKLNYKNRKKKFYRIDYSVGGWFNCQLEDCLQKVFHFVIASYLKFQKCKVSNEVQSNQINRGASTAVSICTLPNEMLQQKSFSKNRSYVCFKARNMCQPCHIIVGNTEQKTICFIIKLARAFFRIKVRFSEMDGLSTKFQSCLWS